MTPEQVSALSDTELNRAMIWLYPINKFHAEYGDGVYTWVSDKERLKIDYLADYNLTMPLVIESNLKVDTHRLKVSAIGHYPTTTNTVILRAACECLVLIALDDK